MMTYFKEIASGFWSLLAGMAVTIRYFIKPVVTVQYPRQKIEMSPAYRGYPRLLLDSETQTHRCIACEMCARICPSQLISVEGIKLPGAKQKVPYTYVHEHYYCSLCGLCIEVCPTTALEYSREYRLAGFRREDAVIDHLTLLRERQQAAGLPLTPIPTAEEIAAAVASEAAAREAREKETAARGAQARPAKPVQTPEEAKSPKSPPEEVKE
jgi:NADH-quinone oxidoreductase subunit I